jgi:putative N6-adenine-specific DNA methylase
VLECFAVCSPGLEAVVAGELLDRKLRIGRPERGGVPFRATTRQLYAANVWLRTASRVLVRVAAFRARTFAQLEREAAALAWQQWVGPDNRVQLRVSSSASALYHTGAIAQRVAAVAGGSSDVEAPPQLVVVRVRKDTVSVSVDTSGEHLHRRGWRLETAKAPLRETLAAAMVLGSGWDARAPFADPMCGSGTIAIEAALLALGRAPGGARHFAFERWPAFEPGTWASVREEVRRAEAEGAGRPVPLLLASDRDEGAVRAARANAERAGLGDALTVARAALTESIAGLPEGPGWLVTNPPYGARIGGRDLRDLYAALGELVRRDAPTWHVGMLVADRRLAGHTRLPFTERFSTANGGIPVTFATAPPAVQDR